MEEIVYGGGQTEPTPNKFDATIVNTNFNGNSLSLHQTQSPVAFT